MESYIFSLQCFFTSSQADVPLLIGYFSLSFTLQSRLGYSKYCFKSAPFISSLASFNAAFYRLFLSFTTWQSRLWISHFRFNEIYEKVHLLSLLRQHGEGEPVNFETSHNDDDEKSERMAQICITNIYDFLNSPQSKFTAYIIWSWWWGMERKFEFHETMHLGCCVMLTQFWRECALHPSEHTKTRFTSEIIHVNFIPSIQCASSSSSPIFLSLAHLHSQFNSIPPPKTRRSCWKVIIIINYIERININGLIYLNLICEIYSNMNAEDDDEKKKKTFQIKQDFIWTKEREKYERRGKLEASERVFWGWKLEFIIILN